MKPFDITTAQFRVCDAMRYDTPGDYFFKDGLWQFEVWSGLSRPEYIQEVFGHEVQEAMILCAAGITPEMVDVIDEYRLASWSYGNRARRSGLSANSDELELTCFNYEAIPRYLRDLYDEAHFKAIGWGRLFIEACNLDWKTYQQKIIDSRGKIPVREGK